MISALDQCQAVDICGRPDSSTDGPVMMAFRLRSWVLIATIAPTTLARTHLPCYVNRCTGGSTPWSIRRMRTSFAHPSDTPGSTCCWLRMVGGWRNILCVWPSGPWAQSMVALIPVVRRPVICNAFMRPYVCTRQLRDTASYSYVFPPHSLTATHPTHLPSDRASHPRAGYVVMPPPFLP